MSYMHSTIAHFSVLRAKVSDIYYLIMNVEKTQCHTHKKIYNKYNIKLQFVRTACSSMGSSKTKLYNLQDHSKHL